MKHYEVVVVGGGISGVSIACELAADRTVCVLEAERELAMHTTGRSFAPHGEPVAAWDADVDGLFWFVGQGGYGIQIAPALAVEGAATVRG